MSLNFLDPQIWVTISFILFFVFFGKLIWRQFSSFLDNKILEIKNEINEASKLHQDAKDLLASESKKIQDLDLVIKEIIDDSKNKSYEILLENKNKIESQIKILEKEALEKIQLIKHQAQEEIKKEIVDKATLVAEDIIKNKLSEKNLHSIMQDSVEQTKKILN
ncbi:MAG: ATP synthase subunit b [Alphaproteobacteria bacterium MarineAlpha9_Bin4]|nr:MAG: ATP synthase subunit b [Alphaproteobacteria bacterium MarineAlpha9_Bin4]|tara:strand:- start:524 stop:1015 length:492 start_codon:yes stop_codon:yes gene_type:complete